VIAEAEVTTVEPVTIRFDCAVTDSVRATPVAQVWNGGIKLNEAAEPVAAALPSGTLSFTAAPLAMPVALAGAIDGWSEPCLPEATPVACAGEKPGAT
jgi:hypothetical protein